MKTSMRFDLVDLRLFLLVIEAASITHGAARAGMALASASERIRLMEDSLGAPLLERNRRGVRATPAGSALGYHAQSVIQQVERACGTVGVCRRLEGPGAPVRQYDCNSRVPPGGVGRIPVTPSSDRRSIWRSVPAARSCAIAQNLAGIGIVGDEVNPAKELQTFPFAEDRLVLIAARDHVVSHQRTIAFREALAYDYVGLAAGHALQEQMEDHAARAGRRLKLRVRVPGFDAVCQVVGSGIGVAVVPAAAARRYRRSTAIRIIALTDNWAPRRLTICVRSFAALPAHGQRLVEHLRARAHA